jgi:uncharacterized protein YdiU (UPF0061 family)
MSISGETIDYGPCAFMDAYHPATVFSSIDQFGRYAYANQPRIAVWNLARLAETLLPLLSEREDEAIAQAEEALKQFQSWYEAAFHFGLSKKLGLLREQEGDLALVSDLLELMAANEADFTLTFRRLADDLDAPEGSGATRALFRDPMAFDAWSVRWHERLSREAEHDEDRRQAMNAVNPKYIPRNHRIEAVINAAVDSADFGPFEELLSVVTRPFDEQPEMSRYADPPLETERVLQTFCGT